MANYFLQYSDLCIDYINNWIETVNVDCSSPGLIFHICQTAAGQRLSLLDWTHLTKYLLAHCPRNSSQKLDGPWPKKKNSSRIFHFSPIHWMLKYSDRECKTRMASIYFVEIRELWLQIYIFQQWGQLRLVRWISRLTILNHPLPGAGQLIPYLKLWSWASTPERTETLSSGYRWIITVLSTPCRKKGQQNSLRIKLLKNTPCPSQGS